MRRKGLRLNRPAKQTNRAMAQYELKTREGVNWVEVTLNNEMVRTESGAMRYMLGNIAMESKASQGGSGGLLGGLMKAAITGETLFRPQYTGQGKLVLEPTLTNFFVLQLNNEEYILDRGAYWASDGSIEVSAKRNQAVAGIMGGEGLFQTAVRGSGVVVVQSPGPVEVLDLVNQRLVVDGTFAVARTSSLNYRVEKSTKSLLGSMTSGEGFVNVLEGTGRVYLSPVPNLYVMLQSMMASMVPTSTGG